MAWSPAQYLRFAQPRLRPALDLLAHVDVASPRLVYDLGCGTGEVTRLLANRWPMAEVIGVDASAEMLAEAARDSSSIQWEQQNLTTWKPTSPADVIYSNAALHWLPRHDKLFPALADALAANGVLAVQMPRNFSAPSHTAMHDAVRAGPWRSQLEHLIAPPPVAAPHVYFSLLSPYAKTLDIWETEYLHVLEGQDAVKEWTKGTWLKRFLDALDQPQRGEFEAEYARRVAAAYPPLVDGRTLFPFRRLFIVLRKS